MDNNNYVFFHGHKVIPEIIEEHTGKNYIKIMQFNFEGKWTYGYQIFVAGIIRAKFPSADKLYPSREEAKAAAKREIKQILENDRKAKSTIKDFIVIFQNQLEFDFEY